MARLSFGRTVVKTICRVKYIDENNDMQETTVELFGDYSISTAQRPALKALNAKGGVVTEIRHTSFYGVMSIQDFAKYCKKSKKKEW